MTFSEFNTISSRLQSRKYEFSLRYWDLQNVDLISITGGDSNCPHPKYYDPSDGHGFTHVHMDDDRFDELPDEATDFDYAKAMVIYCESVEGLSRGLADTGKEAAKVKP